MVKKILIAVAVLAAVLLVLVLRQPDSYKVVRSATINASQSDVFALINDFHQWEKWSPWTKMDPQMKMTYSGSGNGKGAVYHWAGNGDVGEGRMTILETSPSDRVYIKLEFIKPFESNSMATFLLKPETGTATNVTWEMSGESNFMTKAMTLFMSMDKMVGADFEKGLAQMKSAAESARK